MSEKKRSPQAVESVPSRPAVLQDESSKSTPSSADQPTDVSSTSQMMRTPATPFSPPDQSPRRASVKMPGSTASGDSSAKQAKVAIPRLKRNAEGATDSAKPGGRHRVTHACEPCRHRKTKCSGERPACRHCTDFKIQCYYADGKRDRVKKQFGTMQDKVAEYERVLRELSLRVDERDADLIRSTLDRNIQLDQEDVATDRRPSQSIMDQDAEESGAESEASGGAGSTGALDRAEEDFTRESARVTGFMGKNSDVTWLQRLRQENKYGEGTTTETPHAAKLAQLSGSSFQAHNPGETPTNVPLPEADDGFTIQDSSYHLNDMAISTYDHIDAYELPTTDMAQRLFSTYMLRCQPSFPIVGQANLTNQFFKFVNSTNTRAPPKWLAILNLIFAIGAKYSHVVQADWRADDRDHLIYFNRARLLSFDNEIMFQHPDLQMIQIIGLMACYLITIDQVNRAWSLCGLAIRHATALGLNMRNASSDLPNELKEIRYRVWWALYVMEHRLCTLTGRVNCVLDDHMTTPLPVPLAEDQFKTEYGMKLLDQEHQTQHRAPASNTHTPSVADSANSSRSGSKANESRSPSAPQGQGQGQPELDWAKDAEPGAALYFLYLVQLARLTQETFHKLYNPTAIEGKWTDIQYQMDKLDQCLETWYRTLPAVFDFQRNQRDRNNYEPRLALGFFYYATKMMIHRPCLCRMDRKIPNQSEKSRNFNHQAALKCVQAAQDQLALIPEEPNPTGLLKVGPWSSILHLLVQSATVIMLEISFRVHHMPEQADELLGQAKKAIRWLHSLGNDSLAAARAWKLCHQMLRDAAGKIGRPILDVPQMPPRAMTDGGHDGLMASGPAHNGLYPQNEPSASRTDMFAQSNPMSMSNMVSMDNFSTPMFNPLMLHDQLSLYPQGTGVNPSQMSYATDSNMMQYQPTTDADMTFMDQFTQQQGNQQNAPGRGAGTGFE